jgi:hypothetical protein
LHLKQSREIKTSRSLECDISLLPIELFFRQRTISNISTFAAQLKESKDGQELEFSTNQSGEREDGITRRTSFSFRCPSITFSIPLVKQVVTGPLFNRCGETLNNAPVEGASLGFLLEGTAFEWSKEKNDEYDAALESSGRFSCLHMLFFASSPVGDQVAVDTIMQRTDIFLASGRTEVNPFIPISLELKQDVAAGKEGNHGRDSFPIVPAISSFKARQEDEDEELKIDRLLFSKLRDVNADSRKELRGTDPQISMLSDAEKCDFVVVLNVPEIISDLTTTEMETLLKMLEAARPDPSSPTAAKPEKRIQEVKAQSVCLAANFDQITISLKQDFRIEDLYGDKKDRFSCLLAINTFRTHALLLGPKIKHVRLLAHEPCLYTGKSDWLSTL